MKLAAPSVEWAIEHLNRHNDTDLFPSLIEYNAIHQNVANMMDAVTSIDLPGNTYYPCRRFIIPKDEYSYRVATQLYPVDSIILTSLIHQYGQQIESRRLPQSGKQVFSHRFNPGQDWRMYGEQDTWSSFWDRCREFAATREFVAVIDIADFYNQISHHVLENQLNESKLPQEATRWILNLLKHITQRTSRGIPIGPHACHLLAELSLVPVDNTLQDYGLEFCRSVDDIMVFCRSRDEAKTALYRVAEVLDKQQRLIMQKAKTKIYDNQQFAELCNKMIADQPIDDVEQEILQIIRKHSGGDPYVCIDKRNLPDADLKWFDKKHLEHVVEGYLLIADPDFVRLRWFLRRLSQVGMPGAVEYCLQNITRLMPALSDLCHYFISSSPTFEGDWNLVGNTILKLLDTKLITSNEYFQLSLISLFSRNPTLNHIVELLNLFPTSSNHIRREIILSACHAERMDWLRLHKEAFPAFDLWCQDAYVYACHILPVEERKFFLKNQRGLNVWTDLVRTWSNSR